MQENQPGLVDALLEIHRSRQTGILRAELGTVKKQLAIRGGLLAYAESNAPDDHLVRILVRMKLVQRTTLNKVAAMMKEGMTADQAVLRGAKISAAELQEGLREQAVGILANLLGWAVPKVRFYPGDRFLRKLANLGAPLPATIVLAARRVVAEHRVPSSLISLKGYLLPAEAADNGRREFPLSSAEAFAFSTIQGPIPIEEVLAVLPSGEAQPMELIQRLLILGLIDLRTALPEEDAGRAALSLEIDDMLVRFETASLYEILSVPPDARDTEIKAAYHELARRYHPDRFQSAEHDPELRTRVEKLFTYVNRAYSTLSDAPARSEYDTERARKANQLDSALQARSSTDTDQEKMVDGLYRAGRIALGKGDYERAVTHLKECVWLRPEVAKFHHYLGIAQSGIVKLRKEAERHLLKALELDSTSLDSYMELGKLYMKVELPKRAAVQFQQALRWDPGNAEALRLLGSIK
jgi:tetratricopeptide (TPR) repeat protein